MLTRLAALVAPPLCWGCSGAAPRGSPLCRACARGLRRLPPELADLAGVPCFSAVAYEGAARDLVRALKFHAALGVADSMAAAIVATAPEGLFAAARARAGAARPRPGAPARVQPGAGAGPRRRERTGCAVVECLERRGGPGGTQVGRDRAERALALAGSMHASGAAAGSGGCCSWTTWPPPARPSRPRRALRGAGCEPVQAVTYARTLGRL